MHGLSNANEDCAINMPSEIACAYVILLGNFAIEAGRAAEEI